MSLQRRAPLRRGGRVNPRSAKKQAQLDDPERDVIRAAVLRRDGFRCVLAGVEGAGPCQFGLSMHHVVKEGQGGPWTLENLRTMCVGHNGRIESDAELAALCRKLGLVKSAYGG